MCPYPSPQLPITIVVALDPESTDDIPVSFPRKPNACYQIDLVCQRSRCRAQETSAGKAVTLGISTLCVRCLKWICASASVLRQVGLTRQLRGENLRVTYHRLGFQRACGVWAWKREAKSRTSGEAWADPATLITAFPFLARFSSWPLFRWLDSQDRARRQGQAQRRATVRVREPPSRGPRGLRGSLLAWRLSLQLTGRSV